MLGFELKFNSFEKKKECKHVNWPTYCCCAKKWPK